MRCSKTLLAKELKIRDKTLAQNSRMSMSQTSSATSIRARLNMMALSRRRMYDGSVPVV